MALDTPILFLATTDQDRAISFYRDVLGLSILSTDEYAAIVRVGRLLLRIQKVDRVVRVPYTSLGWEVEDLKAEMVRLKARGVRFETFDRLEQGVEGVWMSPAGASIAWFRDPDGQLLSLTQMPAKKPA